MTKAIVRGEIESGRWVVQSLAALAQGYLAEDLAGQTTGVTALSLARYRGVISDFDFLRFGRGLERNWRLAPDAITQKINSAVEECFLGARLTSFEKPVADLIRSALRHVWKIDSNLFDLIIKSETAFIRIKDSNFRSASHPHLLGAILIGDKMVKEGAPEVAVSIVHECAHQELFYLNLLDRLVNEGFDENARYAPFQNRERPPLGRLHSLWALYRMLQFEKERGEIEPNLKPLLFKSTTSFVDGELTDFAKCLVSVAASEVA